MNKTHRVIWNQVRNCFVVAGETAKAKGKPSSTRKVIAAAITSLFIAPGMASAICPPGVTPVTGAETSAQCYNDQDVTINNTGSITVSDVYSATAVYVAPSTYSKTFINNGSISTSVSDSYTDSFSNAYAYAYGVDVNGALIGHGSLTNTGSISVNAATSMSATVDAAASTSYARAYSTGIYMGDTLISDHALTNAGTINSTGSISLAAEGNAQAWSNYNYAKAYGIDVRGDLNGASALTNTGHINTNASISIAASNATGTPAAGAYNAYARAYGILVSGALNSDHALTNSGTISANASTSLAATGDAGHYARAYARYTYANAYGIDVRSDINGNAGLTNSGTVNANASTSLATSGAATAGAWYVRDSSIGVNAHGGLNSAGALNNSGTISSNASTSITASGSASDYARAYAYNIRDRAHGIYVNGNLNGAGALTNSGIISADSSITISATGSAGNYAATQYAYAYASGIDVSGDLNLAGALINSGTISTNATISISAAGSADANAHAYSVTAAAYGINVNGNVNNTNGLTNSGTINANAAVAISAADSATATADYAYAYAYGIRIRNSLNGSMNNSGTISAVANAPQGRAYGVYVGTLNGTLNNSGTIRATGLGGISSSDAYSIFTWGGTGTINNQAGGLLDGRLYAGDGGEGGSVNVINDGTIDTKMVNSNVSGDYTQGTTGLLKIGATDTNTYGKLTVGGTATLAAGTGIRVVTDPAHTLLVTDVLTNVISANTLSMSTINVTDNILALNFVATNNGSNGVDLTTVATGITSVTAAVQGAGQGSTSGAAGVLDTLMANADSQPSEIRDFLYSLGGAGTQQEVADKVSQVLPLISGGLGQATLGAMHSVNRVVQARQEANLGASSGDTALGDKQVWVKPFGSWANQDNRNGTTGYDAKTYGLVVGADTVLAETSRIGAAFAYSRSNIDSNSSVALQDADVDSYQAILYGSHALSAQTEANFQLDVGIHNNEGRRHVGTSVARSDYDSTSAHAGVGLAHTMSLSAQTSFTPSVRADYSWVEVDGYSERGAGALNLNVGKVTADELILSVDGKVTHALSAQTKVTANLGLGYDAINDQASITASFAGAPTASFVTKGIDPSPWLIRGGLGLVYQASDRTQITARYDVEGREDFSNQTASVKARWAF